MVRNLALLLLSLLLLPSIVVAQGDILEAIEEELFYASEGGFESDPYGEAVIYYTTPVEVRRRGLDWWLLRDFNARFVRPAAEYEAIESGGRVRLSSASERYRCGVLAETGGELTRGWSLGGEVDYRTGRDLNVEGVFSSDVRSQLSVAKRFGGGRSDGGGSIGNQQHHLKIKAELPFLLRALQSSATQESFDLLGNNLYNPSWGLYDGEVRSARVSRYRVAELSAEYCRPLAYSTDLSVRLDGNLGRRSVSSLGWYDSYNPTPDYYRKMASYLADGDTKSAVEQLWRDNDQQYTQINWDELVEMNSRSSSGVAYYLLEDRVTYETNGEVEAIFESDLSRGLTIRYGGVGRWVSDRLYKEVADLLGADYHLDIDQYIGDYANLGNDMQNDLRNPNREVGEGERFGYDYTRHRLDMEAVVGLDYNIGALSLAFNCRFGDARLWREGHYEKERFSGDGSCGDSNIVVNSTSSFDIKCGYIFASQHRLSLHGAICRMPQDHHDLFIEEQSANRLVDQLSPRELSLLSLGYNFRSKGLRVNIEGYYQNLANQNDVWSGYDDLSYSYTDIVVSGLSLRSLGVEACATYDVNRSLKLEVALAAGDYTYDSAPLVQLYANDDMGLLSESYSIATEGCKVGNAPQLVVSGGADVYVSYGLSLSVDCSYAAGRYIAPSFTRRSERILRGAGSVELVDDIVEQRSLGSVFDLTLSALRSFKLRGGDRLSLYLRVENVLGDRDRVKYGRESSRILRGSEFATTSAYYLQADEYIYGSARGYYFSVGYNF